MPEMVSVERVGRAWVFGDHVNTDVMMPGAQVLAGRGLGRPPTDWCFEAIRPGWSSLVRAGDVIVAGKNFGCGSGRNAPALLREAGISAVAADSISRAFFRNSVNCALPALECPGVSEFVTEGATVTIDVSNGTLRMANSDLVLHGLAWMPDSPPYQILLAGGIEEFVRRKLRSRSALR